MNLFVALLAKFRPEKNKKTSAFLIFWIYNFFFVTDVGWPGRDFLDFGPVFGIIFDNC